MYIGCAIPGLVVLFVQFRRLFYLQCLGCTVFFSDEDYIKLKVNLNMLCVGYWVQQYSQGRDISCC